MSGASGLRNELRSDCRKILAGDSQLFAVEIRDHHWNLVEVVERERATVRKGARRKPPPDELTPVQNGE